MTPAGPGPLAGVRVLELASVVMAPYAGQILGDLGAEVTKVETGSGDSNAVYGESCPGATPPSGYRSGS